MLARALKITQSVLTWDDGFLYVIDDQGDGLIFERDGQGFGKAKRLVPRKRKIYYKKDIRGEAQAYWPKKWERNGERIEAYLIKENRLRYYRILEKIASLSFYRTLLKKAWFWVVSIPLTLIALCELINKIL